jgi:glutamine synthetase
VSSFAERCGAADAARSGACEAALALAEQRGLERIRIGWCDTHGVMRGKTLMASALESALHDGVSMVSTILLKDTSDRTAFRVFDTVDAHALPGFRFANNLVLLPDPHTLRELPWAPGTGWMRAEAWFDDGTPVPHDTRRLLRAALDRLAHAGWGLVCGLEVEFHVYRLDDAARDPSLDPQRAGWPGDPPAVRMIHPGYSLLAENWADLADEPLRLVQRTAQELGLPLRSLEIELGPSQVEAVFDATDALDAADDMVLFRNGVRQSLRRHGYHASFVCRPPFPHAMASGWHLHQSLVERTSGRNAFRRDTPAPDAQAGDARATLSDVGAHWLGGLLAHARGMAAVCTPTVNGFSRFRPNAMAPQAVSWGRDNRGAMLRVLGTCGDAATRIENRIGEPMANPYLYVAAQVHAGLDGLERRLDPGRETDAPYAAGTPLPASLGEGIEALLSDDALVRGFSAPIVDWYARLKRSELARHDAAEDREAWQAREYFGRF